MTLQRLTERPADSHGVPVGWQDWRFVVEALLPGDDDSTWGVATWNTGVWSEVGWIDATTAVRSLTWTRGSDQFGGRPTTGVAIIMLGNQDGDWSPWGGGPASSAYFGPGTMIRLAVVEPGGAWIPQFCGTVESWPEVLTDSGAESYVTMTVVETTAMMAEINDNALGAAAGSGDMPWERLERLLAAAEWPFGLFREAAVPGYPLQSTMMAGNRLTECHLTADSADAVFHSHRSGVGVMRPADARARDPWWMQPADEYRASAQRAMLPDGVEFAPVNVIPTAAPVFNIGGTTKYLSIPDSAALDITGDITIIVDMEATSGDGYIASKWGGAGQRSWSIRKTSTSTIEWRWSADGTNALTMTTAAILPAFARCKLAVGFDANNGSGSRVLWVSYSIDGGQSWTLMEAQAIGSTSSIFASTAAVLFGGGAVGSAPAVRLFGGEVRSGLASGATPGGSSVLAFDGGDVAGMAVTATSFPASTGQTVTLVGSVLAAVDASLVYAAPFTSANDLEALVNDVRLARVGGTQYVAEDATSIGRWKRRVTLARGDLLNSADNNVEAIAAAIRDRRSNVTRRPGGITVMSMPGQLNSNMPGMCIIDIGDECTVVHPNGTRIPAAVASMRHQLSPMSGTALLWTCEVAFDVYSVPT